MQNATPPLVLTAEICGLYFSPSVSVFGLTNDIAQMLTFVLFTPDQIKLGWKDYLFPNLANLYDYLQESVAPAFLPSLRTNRLQSREDSMESVGSISSRSRSSLASKIQQISQQAFVITEKLPSFITLVSSLTEVHLSHLPSSVLDTLTCKPSILKKLPLRSNTEKLVEKLPAIWKMVRLMLILIVVAASGWH